MSLQAKLTELNNERLNVHNQMLKVLDAADARSEKKGVLTSEEDTHYRALNKRIDELDVEIVRRQEAAKREKDLATLVHEPTHRPAGADARAAEVTAAEEKRYIERIRQVRQLLSVEGERRAINFRAFTTDNEGQMGAAVMAEKFVADIIKSRDDNLWIRQLATKIPCEDAKSLGALTLDSDPDDGEWTTETKTGSEDEDMELGKREMEPHRCARRIKISRKLLRLGAWLLQYIQKRLAYKSSVAEEKAYISGSGVGRPLGVFTPSPSGISTARDVRGVNTATEIKSDTIYDMTYSLKEAYLQNAVWVLHRLAMKQIRKLKTDAGYLWQPSLVAGQPDMLAGRPLRVSEFAPSTFEADAYVAVLGDFSYYWIADGMGYELRRADEIYIEEDMVGLFGFFEADGQPVLGEAFARMQMAAA